MGRKKQGKRGKVREGEEMGRGQGEGQRKEGRLLTVKTEQIAKSGNNNSGLNPTSTVTAVRFRK